MAVTLRKSTDPTPKRLPLFNVPDHTGTVTDVNPKGEHTDTPDYADGYGRTYAVGE